MMRLEIPIGILREVTDDLGDPVRRFSSWRYPLDNGDVLIVKNLRNGSLEFTRHLASSDFVKEKISDKTDPEEVAALLGASRYMKVR